MYPKPNSSTVPSDAQAREKLALYVYEYLLHSGAQKAAQTFLTEIRWEKNIILGESPGFLHDWWCVFWDLYCAAPIRRDQCNYSSEAMAFHDHEFVRSEMNVPRFPSGLSPDINGTPGQPSSMGQGGPINPRIKTPQCPGMGVTQGGPVMPSLGIVEGIQQCQTNILTPINFLPSSFENYCPPLASAPTGPLPQYTSNSEGDKDNLYTFSKPFTYGNVGSRID